MSKVDTEKQEVIIETPVVETPEEVTEDSLREQGLGEDEIEMAKEQGLLKTEEKEESKKEDDKKQEKKEEKQEDQEENDDEESEEGEEEQEEEVKVEELDSFEKVHNLYETKPEEFKKLPRNVKALYHNSKGLYKRAKTEEQKRQDAEKKAELQAIQNKGAMTKLEKVREALSKEGLTVQDLQTILGDAPKKEDVQEDKKDEGQDQDARRRLINDRIIETEKVGATEYDDFDTIVELANEITSTKPRYLRMMQEALIDQNVTEHELVEMIVDIAKMNEKYGKPSKSQETKKENENVNRMEKNSKKKTSSATIGKGGQKVKSYDALTPEDVLNMSQEEYNKLPDAVRNRLLMEV